MVKEQEDMATEGGADATRRCRGGRRECAGEGKVTRGCPARGVRWMWWVRVQLWLYRLGESVD